MDLLLYRVLVKIKLKLYDNNDQVSNGREGSKERYG